MYEVDWRGVETPPPANCPKQINKSKQKKLEEGFVEELTIRETGALLVFFFFFSFQTNTHG